ncbi:MAG: exonuclease SbcCD subunit D C-terminal domain-containing protein [Gammaproteobacteria bacterium]|nr:exonuclease SbcCD subunit D C-terminal domain-containing protein [Gammaproteobacteria bacterium]
MKILHTSDWHLGQRFYDQERHQEHALFLDFLLHTLQQHKIELLLVCGDIFDNANPSRQAERLYYDFLRRLSSLGHCQAVIVAGNHDSASHLEAPQRLLKAFNIHVVGALSDDHDDALLQIKSQNPHDPGIWLAAVPYLRDRDLRRAVAGERFDEMEQRTKQGVIQSYATLASELQQRNHDNAPMLATGHLTAIGSSLSDSERHIHIGTLGSISAAQFPTAFDYIALGHLHRPQKVGGCETIRYSGSPLPLSFAEIKHDKSLRIISTEQGKIEQQGITIPRFRCLLTLQGSATELQQQIEALTPDKQLTPWLELVLTDSELATNDLKMLHECAKKRQVEILKIGLARQAVPITHLKESDRSIEELQPEEVFQHRLEHYQGRISHETLRECFQQLLNHLHEEETL